MLTAKSDLAELEHVSVTTGNPDIQEFLHSRTYKKESDSEIMYFIINSFLAIWGGRSEIGTPESKKHSRN